MAGLIRLPLRFGEIDLEVQDFVETQVWQIGPYSNPALTRSAQQIFERALYEFGEKRCRDLEIQVH
jgi:hypothetical protein